jgi:hypothetical protein
VLMSSSTSNIRQHPGSTCNAGISIMSNCSSSSLSADSEDFRKCWQRVLYCCRCIIGCNALCRLNTDTKKHAAGGKWALVLEHAKVGEQHDGSVCLNYCSLSTVFAEPAITDRV